MHHPAALTLRSYQGKSQTPSSQSHRDIVGWSLDRNWYDWCFSGCAVIEFPREGCALFTTQLLCPIPLSTANIRSLALNLTDIQSVHLCMSSVAAREAAKLVTRPHMPIAWEPWQRCHRTPNLRSVALNLTEIRPVELGTERCKTDVFSSTASADLRQKTRIVHRPAALIQT